MKELKGQIWSALLVVLTAAVVVSAVINFQQQKRSPLPEDGVIWVDRDAGVEALYVSPASTGDKAGLRAGDVLLKVGGLQIENAIDVTRVLVGVGSWNQTEYLIRRAGVEVKAKVIIAERAPEPTLYYQYLIGLTYLSIGLFVYFRRDNAQKSQHFYVLCLASFILSTFHYTGKLNSFDKVIYWGNVVAGLAAPTIFVHFALVFPEPVRWLKRRWRTVLLYLPMAAMLAVYVGVASGTLRVAISLVELRWILDRFWLQCLAGGYLLGGLVLAVRYRKADEAIVRQQLKWLRNGAILGVLPFTALYVVPYTLGVVPGDYLKLSVLSLLLVPTTWAYAILRYRLMDVDLIFQQGYVYTLATLCVLGIFYGLVFSLGKFEELSPTAFITLVLIATFVFQPIRNWIQEQFDRYYFYKDRYDYRRTLMEFARELGSETDLDAALTSVADRLSRTLSIPAVAFFLWDENQGNFSLHKAFGVRDRNGRSIAPGTPLDLSFLPPAPDTPYLFIERTRHFLDVRARDWSSSVRQTIADLDLTYYIPCLVRGRTIAYLGLSRTEDGDFLTSDDVELLTTLACSVGIAVENSRLYSSLERKVEEYERLKDFSENIVESINVGILAADLDDRVESWNSQIERLTGIPRDVAQGRCLSELFPADLVEEFERVRGETGIRHIYKFVLCSRDMPTLADGPVLAPSGDGNGDGSAVAVAVETAPAPARESVLNVAIAPLVSKDLRQIGRLIIFDDITERDELERRLLQADKLTSIGLLAAGVAHEVNTPLAVISTYAQMLAKQVSGDDQKSRLLEKIAKQTFRASEIVNSLLNFSRTSPKEFDEVGINRAVQETLTLIGHQLDRAHVHIHFEPQEPLPAIRGDFGRLQQVFLNLFLNARDAMEGGGELTVHTSSDDASVRIEVADNGQGIQAEYLSRIYDPFFTTKGARKGTGLGLSVTYGIVKEHGGSIDVESRPGAGTVFRLEFPVARKPVNA
jgi:two-component system, NtrC family, sensor kinase